MSSTNQLIFGLHAVESVLQTQPERVQRVLILQDRKDKKMEGIVQLAKQRSIPVDYASRSELDRMTDEANHQGVIAFCTKAHAYTESDLINHLSSITVAPLLLILDGVQDPHNLGACFRTANAAGVHAIIAPKDKSVGITPVVTKVASGATEVLPFVQVTNLVRTIEKLKELGIWIYGAAAEAEKNLYQTDLSGAAAFVLGAEGTGLRRLTREHCDVLINIPMFGSVSSLNVSVATGVILFEASRQRMQRK